MWEIVFSLNEDSGTYTIFKDGIVEEDYMEFVNDFDTTVDVYLNRIVSDITGKVVENLGNTNYVLDCVYDTKTYKRYVLEEKCGEE